MSRDTVTTDMQQICLWLGLPARSWPPDHYALLGLPPCEPDVDLIEQRVHERLAQIRSYQLSQPAQATAAMTRLAKAFDCLTTRDCKAAYDKSTFPHLRPTAPMLPASRVATVVSTDTAETPAISTTPPMGGTHTGPAWQSAAVPPPVRDPAGTAGLPPLAIPVIAQAVTEPPPIRVPPVQAEPVAAEVARPARPFKPPIYLAAATLPRLRTRRELCDRAYWLRRITRAWFRAGKYVSKPKRRPTKASEDAELSRQLLALEDLAQEMPGVIGEPGQAGYRVFALTTLEPLPARFRALDDDHRITLALDWSAGRKLLAEYRDHLLEQIRRQRRMSTVHRWFRAMSAALAATWAWLVFGLALTGVLTWVIVNVL